eukprot:4562471-Amphidinium_carterae.1
MRGSVGSLQAFDIGLILWALLVCQMQRNSTLFAQLSQAAVSPVVRPHAAAAAISHALQKRAKKTTKLQLREQYTQQQLATQGAL